MEYTSYLLFIPKPHVKIIKMDLATVGTSLDLFGLPNAGTLNKSFSAFYYYLFDRPIQGKWLRPSLLGLPGQAVFYTLVTNCVTPRQGRQGPAL